MRRFIKIFLITLLTLSAIAGVSVFAYPRLSNPLNSVTSIHEDAEKILTRGCVAFYPDNSLFKQRAKDLCDDAIEGSVFDYALIPYGDYYRVDYGFGEKTLVDKNYNPVQVEKIDKEGERIAAEELRYQAKKHYKDLYYRSQFLRDTHPDFIEFDSVSYRIDEDDLVFFFEEYGIDIRIPLGYMQKSIGMDLGYEDLKYEKKTFIDPEHPVIALTFDDGPYSPVGQQIIDTLDLYDSRATFFVVGNRMTLSEELYMMESIKKGNEYGSHTYRHSNLRKLDASSAADAVYSVISMFEEDTGYRMKCYRAPEGAHNSSAGSILQMKDVLWNVDSQDWKSRNAESIKSIVYSNTDDLDVLLFHELYQSTADAIEEIVPHFIDEGYQMVTISELCDYLGVDISSSGSFSGK